MRYSKIFHEPKTSEMSRNISRETSVIRGLSCTDGKYARVVERLITTADYLTLRI